MNETLLAYQNKISNKLWGVVHVPHRGTKRGAVLISYIVSPFTKVPWEMGGDPHTNYWECREIATLFTQRGYDVDIIDHNNTRFIPRKKYTVCVGSQHDMERLSKLLDPHCIKVMHIVSADAAYHNAAERARLDALEVRRGVRLAPQRKEPESSGGVYADFLEGFGNATIRATYAQYNKNIYPIPESVSQMFAFPERKDFNAARKVFLWFGGGGAVHKGLDLILEAWNQLPPEYHLHIVGPVQAEKDFMQAYKKELSLPHVTMHPRPKLNKVGVMMVGDVSFSDIANECAALLYLSCSEGTSGAVIQAMHAGLIPIITPQSGIDEAAPCIILEHPTVESVLETVHDFREISSDELKSRARSVWSFARAHHTKEAFSRAYDTFITDVLKLP